MRKILLAGADGQVGQALRISCPAHWQLQHFSHANLDITDNQQVLTVVQQLQPDVIINAAAYTNVDTAEQNQKLAYAVNATGSGNLAQAAQQCQARLIHISTDYVFSGMQGSPYLPTDQPAPLNYYGLSKWRGEQQIQTILPERSIILRTSWVYSRFQKNFVKSLLSLFQQKYTLQMVVDQVSTPTLAEHLAQAIWQIVEKPDFCGIYHFSDAGVTSKYDFAVAIAEEAWQLKLIPHPIAITPIRNGDYVLPAARPAYSVLDKTTTWQDFSLTPVHWREALRIALTGFTYE